LFFHQDIIVFNGYEAIMRLFIAFCKWYADDGFIGNEFVLIAFLFLTAGEVFCFTKKRFGFNIQTAFNF
jgi:hypothetical protein